MVAAGLFVTALAFPNFLRHRECACLDSIANHLRILEGAKEQWALEQQSTDQDTLDTIAGNLRVLDQEAETVGGDKSPHLPSQSPGPGVDSPSCGHDALRPFAAR